MKKTIQAVEILSGRLYWISDVQKPKNIPKSQYFNIDEVLVYQNFNQDFGPLNLAKTWKYVIQLEKLLANPEYDKYRIYHHTSTAADKAANAAFLICAFQVISLGYTAKKALQPFKGHTFRPFRDAGYADCTYKCTLLDCIRGLQYAIKLKWFKYKTFNVKQYQHYQKLQNGDLNWIIPNKFIAFSSPSEKPVDKYGNRTLTPNDYVPVFKKMGVKVVIRLNNKTYDETDFVKNGIKHHDLYFADGSVPSVDIVKQFLEIAESTNGALAIHCKAGLGRTGTLIGCYAMKHFYFPAADFIGYIRIARPGSILGPQQNYLIDNESKMRQQGKNSPIWKEIKEIVCENDLQVKMKNISLVSMSQRQKQIMHNGQSGQGQNLMLAKMKKESINKNTPPISPARSYKSTGKSSSNNSGKYSPSVHLTLSQSKK